MRYAHLAILTAALFLAATESAMPGHAPNDAKPEPLPEGAIRRLGSTAFRAGEFFAALPDGKHVAVRRDRRLFVLDLQTGREVASTELPPINLAVAVPLELRGVYGIPNTPRITPIPDGTALVVYEGGRVYRYRLPKLDQVDVLTASTRSARSPAGDLPVNLGDILGIACSPSGDAILAITERGVLAEMREGKPGGPEPEWIVLIESVPKSPDGEQDKTSSTGYALACGGGTIAVGGTRWDRVRLWDAGKGADGGSLPVAYFTALAVSGDGKRVATSSWGGAKGPRVLQVWTVADRKEIRRWERTFDGGLVALDPVGMRVAVWNQVEAKIEVLDVGTGKEVYAVPTNGEYLQRLAFTPDGRRLLAAGSPGVLGSGGVLRVWDAASGKPAERPGHWGAVRAIRFAPDARTVTAGADGVVIVWGQDGKELRRLDGHTGGVTGLALDPGGKTAFTASEDETIRAWDVATGKEIRKYTEGTRRKIPRALFVVDGAKTLVAVYPGEVRSFDAATLRPRDAAGGKKEKSPWPDEPVSADCLVAGQVTRLVMRDRAGFRVWDLSTGREGLRIDGGARRERGVSGAIALSPKSGEIFSLVDPKELPRTFPTCVGVWDLLNRRYLDVIPIGKKLDLTALAVTPDGKSLVVGDIKGKVYIVDIETKAVRKTFEGHRGAVTCLAVSADGKSLASGSADTTVLVWDLTKP